ncbi:MAG TPA: D-aminoacylase [Candidatus Tumulicola sp.]|nr:D-aminoacylase [Candidatus Tumulicola sp.]
MLDVVLEGGTIVDGTGKPGFVADVAIAGDRIACIGSCRGLDSALRVACAGLVVAPGFIDAHGHSDERLLAVPLAESKIRQGITTEIGGNCGSSPAPLSAPMHDARRERFGRRYGIEVAWSDFAGFFSALERSGSALNFACLVGLGVVREAIGADAPAPLTPEQLEAATRLVRAACDEGAAGVSSGLIYPPGSFADTAELIALAGAAVQSNAPLYATHLRSEGDEMLEAVDEALEVGRRAEVAVQISHHKAAGKRNWGKVHDSLARIERARGSGVDVALDQYPYKASSTTLAAVLPADVNVGGPAAVAARLLDPPYAALVVARLELEYAGRWSDIYVSEAASEKNRSLEGMSLDDVGRRTGRSAAAAAVALLAEEGLEVSAIFFSMCEDDVRTVLSYRHTCIGTDAAARPATGPLALGRPHPRAFGTYPRVFKRYVRDTSLLELTEAVRRATSLPATRFALKQRGELREGWFADVVVFDSERIADTATYLEPQSFSEGIEHVFVNGEAVVSRGAVTGALAGRVLRRT